MSVFITLIPSGIKLHYIMLPPDIYIYISHKKWNNHASKRTPKQATSITMACGYVMATT